jgi:hypothetical protein
VSKVGGCVESREGVSEVASGQIGGAELTRPGTGLTAEGTQAAAPMNATEPLNFEVPLAALEEVGAGESVTPP